ncbi:MAG: flagellar filament capping protein FliD [Desulfuromonas sp.]|nr:flagellar filament capping protein FliD [Desulfuromonas sp.]
MSTVSFGGLATGLDTESLITSLMEIERAPITSMETDIEYMESQNETFESFGDILTSLNSAIGGLDTTSEFSSWAVSTNNSENTFQASASSYAKEGSYQVEVLSMAQQQKDVSYEGFASSTDENLSGTITIGDTVIEYEDISLAALADLVSDSDSGVQAGIVDDGTENGLRLVFTAEDAETTPEILATGSISLDTATDGHTLDGSMAHVVVDGIDMYSGSNTLSGAIYGVTLDLIGVSTSDEISYVKVASDTSSIEEKVDQFVSAYNEMLTFIDEINDADSATGSNFRSIERKMQNLITTQVGGSSNFSSLASLGFETDSETGELSYDSSTLSDALLNNLDDIQMLFVGDDDTDGIAKQLSTYLSSQLDSIDGFVATQTESNDEQIERLETSIERMETRLEKREETLNAQFAAMELLVSELNTQGDYLESFFAEESS